MIELICDQYGLYQCKDSGDLIVEEDYQYEEALNLIRSFSKDEKSCRIIIKNPALFHWFDAPAKQFECKIINYDPVVGLCNALAVPLLPKYLRYKPKWIVECGLLKKAAKKPLIPHETVDEWLKRILLSPVWRISRPIADQDIREVVSWFISNNNQDFHSLTKLLFTRQLDFWAQHFSEKSNLFKWLDKSPFQRARFLVWEQMLRPYPENRIAEWLQHGDIWYQLNLFPERKLHVPDLGLSIPLPDAVTIFVRDFLMEQWTQSPEKTLEFVAGQIEVEKSVLSECLKNQLRNGIPINKELFYSFSKFQNFPEIIELAQQLLPAKKPSVLSEKLSVLEVREWLRDEYLPFYESCAILNILEETITYVEQFETWVKMNYTDLLINGEGMAYRQILQLKKRLDEGPVLVIILDGLDYLCAQNNLLPELQKHGFYAEGEFLPFFAFLPTETFISKPTLVAGRMSSQIQDEVSNAVFYKDLLKNTLNLGNGEIRSATDKDLSINELLQKPAKIYLYLDNQLDREYLHSSLSPYVRQKKYTEHVEKQAVLISEAAKWTKDLYNKTLGIVICSDHGHTVIPKNAHVVEVPNFGDKSTKIRSMISDTIESNMDEDAIWKLKPGLFGLNREMAIPSGYGCFGKRPIGATHGGCTPQELSVPWFFISTRKLKPLTPLVISIEGEIFRRRETNDITINILNSNDFQVSILDCHFEFVEIRSKFPLRIKTTSIEKILATFNGSSIKEEIVEIKGFCKFSSHRGEMKNSVNLKVTTTGAMSTEFDDEFEF
jgi:hypothetical protein